ncbi:hypothetical protein EDC04DRAFT_3145122 [Pisolithus marmoratus]|nr:hypothetical protein EDC04DRAFT_3145122 [Pisolithus marmoratus]
MTASLAQVFEGPFLIGLAVNIFLQGLATMQVCVYFTSFAKDRFWLKQLIVILYLLDTVNCATSIYYLYDALVIHFGDEAYLLSGSWVFAAGTVTTGLVSVVVQHFFAWRAYVLTKNVLVVAAIVLCSLASLGGSLATTIDLAIDPSTFRVSDLRVEVTLWLAGAVLADMIITAALVWHLGRHKALYPALNSIVNQILRMTVQTGVVTTAVAIILLGCYLTNSIGTYVAFSMMLSKLYTNCTLSTLNARRKYEGSTKDEVSHGRSIHPGVVVFQSQRAQGEVFVQVESHQMTDMDDKPSQGMNDF